MQFNSKKALKQFLEEQYHCFNCENAISEDYLDPLLVARVFKEEKVALFCALFAYGNVRAILNFLRACPLESLLEPTELHIQKPYRFQTKEDIGDFFQALSRLDSLEAIFYQGCKEAKRRHSNPILGGIAHLQKALYSKLKAPQSKGIEFLLGKPIGANLTSPLKRYNLFLRWMVRKDCLDLGLWESIAPKDLLLPLDTHTFKVSQKLGILKRKSYDFKAVLEVSAALRELDREDPIKYDFALYRIGQFKGLD